MVGVGGVEHITINENAIVHQVTIDGMCTNIDSFFLLYFNCRTYNTNGIYLPLDYYTAK